DCWAVGYYQTDASNLQTLILRWNGTSWAIVPSPNPNPLPSQNTLLTGVTCTSATDCWAVGYSYDLVTVQTLILRWDGTSWAIVPSPNVTAAESNFLQAVTCVSASDCWAVGNYYGGNVIMPGANQTLILRWDGTSWTIVPSPSTATPTNLLYGVTCASPSDCWAVGQSIDTSG